MLDLKSPISVVWEITNNCNFLCPHCRAYQKYEKEDEELENRIIEELIKSEVLLVNISGGEPLLNPRIFKIVKKLSDNNIHVGISTNGWFYEKYRNEIKDSGVKFVQVSLDGPFEKHEKFRGIKGSYDRAIRALELARDDGMFTQMNVTITSNNIDTLKWNYDKAKELGINRVFYRRVVPTGKAEENKFVLPLREEYYKSIVELANLNSEKLVVDATSIATISATGINIVEIYTTSNVVSNNNFYGNINGEVKIKEGDNTIAMNKFTLGENFYYYTKEVVTKNAKPTYIKKETTAKTTK